jgi:hypothetical protein
MNTVQLQRSFRNPPGWHVSHNRNSDANRATTTQVTRQQSLAYLGKSSRIQPTTALDMRKTNTVLRVPTSPTELNKPETTHHFCLIELGLRL